VVEAAARKGVTLDVTVFPDSTHTADEAARAVGAELGQIVKSLVFVTGRDDGDAEPIVCLISGADRVDLQRLAAVVGRRDVRRASAREADVLTLVARRVAPAEEPRTQTFVAMLEVSVRGAADTVIVASTLTPFPAQLIELVTRWIRSRRASGCSRSAERARR
jgi:hypothetical protein